MSTNTTTTKTRRTIFTAAPKLAIKHQPAAGRANFATDQPKGADQQGQGAAEEVTTLEGYAMVWNELSQDEDGVQFRFLPGSARFTTPTMALFHHDQRSILGNTANATLRMAADAYGTKVEIDLPDTCCANDVEELIEGKYVQGMSFSMLWDDQLQYVTKTEGDVEVIEVQRFTCDEVTVTAIPSFTSTSIAVKTDPDEAEEEAGATQLAHATAPPVELIAQAHRLAQLRLAVENLE